MGHRYVSNLNIIYLIQKIILKLFLYNKPNDFVSLFKMGK